LWGLYGASGGTARWFLDSDNGRGYFVGNLYVNGGTQVVYNSGTWSISISGNAATATSATNVAGGTAGNVLYQSGAGTTAFVANGTSGQVLTSNGASAPSWQTAAAASKSYAQAMRILCI
jgi:hypothetical protein